ncbi:UDP-N-acetylglucosamine--N-acetylmuramyl-(pentapeptide) pyrophosphoryl-undecaprenol N-acetylglucosamine transferase [Bacteroidia bacterium]|nr:UDP-N-acetylglucosamine--N-acetylmuramyl-(pentapeptide) pyrophosphoryl-undecaprenol N-acetylglucosamine transferase [Bacteroidia bacterium]
MKIRKKVIISGGGTGGHIFPALSIAGALKRLEPDIDILFVGADGKMEMERVPDAGFTIEGLPVRGLNRKNSLSNISVLVDFFRCVLKARKIIKRFHPNIVIGVGGYASGPICMAANLARVPVLLQEQNSYAGVMNKRLANKAVKICVAYEGMERFFKPSKLILTGNPVRPEIAHIFDKEQDRELKQAEGLEYYGLSPDKLTVLVTGGSLGAGTLNKMMESNLDVLKDWTQVQIIWQCGSSYYEVLSSKWKDSLPSNVKMTAFLKRMDLAYACSDIVVARAGAGTISELCLVAKAAILIPSPNVAEDHQTHNAMALVNKGAALMIRDVEAVEKFIPVLSELAGDVRSRLELSRNMTTFGVKDSDIRIAKEVLGIIDT